MSTSDRPVFLLSPARCAGPRAVALPHSQSELGAALRGPGAALGDVFSFLSALYFRGKASYAHHFGAAQRAVPGALVITPGHGLCRLSTRLKSADLAAIGKVEVDPDNPEFVEPLLRDASLLAVQAPESAIVLLGSIATPKYVQPLLSVFGERLLFPRDFVGRGDMSRGGMLLRAVRTNQELVYAPVSSSLRQGRRAPRLSELE